MNSILDAALTLARGIMPTIVALVVYAAIMTGVLVVASWTIAAVMLGSTRHIDGPPRSIGGIICCLHPFYWIAALLTMEVR